MSYVCSLCSVCTHNRMVVDSGIHFCSVIVAYSGHGLTDWVELSWGLVVDVVVMGLTCRYSGHGVNWLGKIICWEAGEMCSVTSEKALLSCTL